MPNHRCNISHDSLILHQTKKISKLSKIATRTRIFKNGKVSEDYTTLGRDQINSSSNQQVVGGIDC